MKNDYAQLIGKAIELHQQGLLEQAEEIYRSILEQDAFNSDSLHMLGVLLCQRNKADVGIPLLEKALEIKPSSPAYHCNLANALHDSGKYEYALSESLKALSLKPDYAEALFIKGLSLNGLGRKDEAIESYVEAIFHSPDLARAHNNLGILLMEKGDLNRAITCYTKAIEADPAYTEAYNNLGNLYNSAGNPSMSLRHFEKAISLKPDYADAYNNIGGSFKNLGRIEESLACYMKALELNPSNPIYYSNYLLTLHYREGIRPEDLYTAHRDWACRFAPLSMVDMPSYINTAQPDKPLRIGYFSGDFRTHSVAYFIEPILEKHDRTGFEIYCYSDVVVPDDTTMRLKNLVRSWRDINHLSTDDIIKIIRDDHIDILVDLAGHTSTRLMEICAHKPAPVQATYLGYPDTTGLPAMDYRITDAQADPIGLSDTFNTETLIRLKNSFLCYKPPHDIPAVQGLPAKAKGYITFGSFNNRAKINPSTVKTWAEILKSLPSSRFILKATSLCDELSQRSLMLQFTQQGIEPERVSIHPYRAKKFDHFSLYNEIDIGLDTFPYNGTTTTCEALWMGIPVITLQGPIHASRVGRSILTCLGLGDFIASSHQDYIEKALRAGADLETLSRLRLGLREKMSASPLMDALGFTHGLEREFRTVWRTWCKKGLGSNR